MVSVFAAAPVAADKPGEAFGASFAARQAADVDVPGAGDFAVGAGDGFVDDDQAAGVGQFDFGRLDRRDFYFPFFEATVAFVGRADKKGGSPVASRSAVLWAARRSSLHWAR